MRRTRHSSDSKKYFDWLEISASDLLAARVLMEDSRCLEAAGFLCQQCIEKSLKAFLIFHTNRLVDGHNLTWLCRQASKADRKFQPFIEKTASMNRLYIETRYPSDIHLGLDKNRMKAVYSEAQSIYDLVCSLIYQEDMPQPASPHYL